MSDSIPPVSASSTAAAASYMDRMPVTTLGQNDFLKLLATQMSAQDPLNPQSDTGFIAQMAQFGALQNSKDMQTEMQTLRANQLIGQTVTIKLDEDTSLTGVVSAMQMDQAGKPQIVVRGGTYNISAVTSVQATPNTQK